MPIISSLIPIIFILTFSLASLWVTGWLREHPLTNHHLVDSIPVKVATWPQNLSIVYAVVLLLVLFMGEQDLTTISGASLVSILELFLLLGHIFWTISLFLTGLGLPLYLYARTHSPASLQRIYLRQAIRMDKEARRRRREKKRAAKNSASTDTK